MRRLLATAVLALAIAPAGCGSDGGDHTRERPSLAAGKRLFVSAGCGGCHTLSAAGTRGDVGPNFDTSEVLTGAQIRRQLVLGVAGMPSFRRRLTVRERADVAAFVASALRGRRRPVRLRVRPTGRLPAPVQLPAAAPLGAGRALLLGGLDAADASVASIVEATATGGRQVGSLPVALHDAAAATIGPRVYFFGGGSASGSSGEIRAVDRDGSSRPAGRLPEAASDVAAATIGGTAYVVGGYTGTAGLRSIVSFRPGAGARVVAELPVPLRYAAVAAAGDRVVIAGGTSGVAPQRAILSFDPSTRRVTELGRLPVPLTHASAASLAGLVYVIGGRTGSAGDQTAAILSVDPRTGTVRSAGRLPEPLSDTSAVASGSGLLVFGGRDASGAASDRISTLTASK